MTWPPMGCPHRRDALRVAAEEAGRLNIGLSRAGLDRNPGSRIATRHLPDREDGALLFSYFSSPISVHVPWFCAARSRMNVMKTWPVFSIRGSIAMVWIFTPLKAFHFFTESRIIFGSIG